MKKINVSNVSSLPKVLDYQQQWQYDSVRSSKQKDIQFQETLLQTLNRIETKLDILLMQKQK